MPSCHASLPILEAPSVRRLACLAPPDTSIGGGSGHAGDLTLVLTRSPDRLWNSLLTRVDRTSLVHGQTDAINPKRPSASPLLMLWTAPPPAHRCHGCGRC